MADTLKIKVHQKLGLETFKRLNAQLKETGVSIISKNPHIEYITPGDVEGKVISVFNLGKKLEVMVSAGDPDATYHFQQLKNVFFLSRITD